MGIEKFHTLFEPKSVAVIGASETPGSVGNAIMNNLVSGGFKGDVFPVNPKYKIIRGIVCLADAADLPPDVDMAVIALPISRVPDIIYTCSQKNMGSAVVISANNDSGPEVRERIRQRIIRAGIKTGMRIMGPDSVGLVNTLNGLNASFMHQTPLAGNIAFLSQSGGFCSSVLDLAVREHVGFSHFVNLGSKIDVNFADMLDYLGSHPQVESIVMYLESIGNMRKFMSAARAVSRVKPVIALKSGRYGKAGSLREDRMYDAAFKRAGILRVKDFQALFDCAEFMAKQPRPMGGRLAIVSNGGGIGLVAKDALASYGLTPAVLAPETVDRLEHLLGHRWSRTNPIELIQASSPENYIKVVKICIHASEIDGLLLLSSPVGTYDCTAIARPMVELLKKAPFPVFTAWLGGMNADASRAIFNRHNIITYDTPERAVKAFANLYQYGRNMEILQEIPYRTDKRLSIDRLRAKKVISASLGRAETTLGPEAIRELLGAYGIDLDPGALAGDPIYNLSIGGLNHPLFGPVIRFGMGGPMRDILDDRAMALPPLNRLLARRTIEATKISKVLHGYNGIGGVDMGLLEETLILVSRMVTDYPEIVRLDLNPVRVTSDRVTAGHAQISIKSSTVSSPGHLIISPYPWWQQSEFTTWNQEPIFIRPIRPGDAAQAIELFNDLSRETVYLRFFSPIKQISKSMLIKLTQIDYDREIALCAFAGPKSKRKLIGVARIIFLTGTNGGEFSIVLADDWHGRGIGSVLLKQALVSAKKYGLDQVSGPVISTNTAMLTLGQRLGFSVALDPESSEYRLSIDLKDLE